MGCSTVQSDKGLATPEDEDVAVEHDEVKEEGEVKRERTPCITLRVVIVRVGVYVFYLVFEEER